MHFETMYLMTENNRFVCTNQFGDVTTTKERADESCKMRGLFDPVEKTVLLYHTEQAKYWNIGPDLATPHVNDLVTIGEDSWTTFSYQYADADETLMTLRNGNGGYVSSIDIGRRHEVLAASAATADEASRFRVIRFADNA